jgi:hypothetical protein
VNQIQQVSIDGHGQMYMTMYGPPGGPYELRLMPQFTTSTQGWLLPNVSTIPVTVGDWHLLKWTIDYTGDTTHGRVRWWLDSTLVGDYADVPFPDQGLLAYGLTPEWGGAGDAKSGAGDFFRYDHVHVSRDWTSWPNEPIGLTLLSDYGFTDSIPMVGEGQLGESRWSVADNETRPGEHVWHADDPSAPQTPSSVARWVYPDSMTGNHAPGTLWFGDPTTQEGYAGFWWKVSDPWTGHPSNVNKIAFWLPTSGGDIYLSMYGPPGGPYRLRADPQFIGLPNDWLLSNIDSTPLSLGIWHRIEWHVRYADPGQTNGVVQWWLDGALQGDHTDVPTPSTGGLGQFEFSPTWGGQGGEKVEEDYVWLDHVHLSTR